MARHQHTGIGTAQRSRSLQGGSRVVRRLSGDAGSVRAARVLVEALLAEEADDVREVAVLLVDELVTNALVHGGGWFILVVEVGDDLVRVVVDDRSAAVPYVLRPNAEREHGRGMAIVDAFATAWGADLRPTHKRVWFELALHP